jgi:hypothetical protein
MQYSERQAHHLQVLATGGGGDVSGLGPHIEDDAPLQPGNEKVCTLADNFLLDTGKTVEDDGSGTALDVVDGLSGEEDDGRADQRCAVRHGESSGRERHVGWQVVMWRELMSPLETAGADGTILRYVSAGASQFMIAALAEQVDW